MEALGIAIAATIAASWGFIIVAPMVGGSKRAIVKRAQAEGRHRFVEIDGRQYHAIRATETILRSPSGRARAVLVAAGRDRDPDMVDGKMILATRWVKLRSIKRGVFSNHERWVRAKGWTVEGREEIEYHMPV